MNIVRSSALALIALLAMAPVHATLPSSYKAVEFDAAVAAAKSDGKPIILYFSIPFA
jgi:hypothetical protein